MRSARNPIRSKHYRSDPTPPDRSRAASAPRLFRAAPRGGGPRGPRTGNPPSQRPSRCLGPRSAFFGPRSAFFGPRSAFFGPRSAFFGPRSAFFGPRSAFFGPRSAFFGPRSRSGPS